jgi:hypothetical protein
MTTLLLDRQIAKQANADFLVTLLFSLVGLGVTLALALSGVDMSFAG